MLLAARAGVALWLLISLSSLVWGARPLPELKGVEVIASHGDRWAAVLSLSAAGSCVKGFDLDDGRFVVDVEPASWLGGVVQRETTGGANRYRWAQYTVDPATVRFVVEHKPLWTCKATGDHLTVSVECTPRSSTVNLPRTTGAGFYPPAPDRDTGSVIASPRCVELYTPLRGFTSADILARSLDYDPHDVIRDGLPHFGSKRDDWMGKSRTHKGLDIYCDDLEVLAMGTGTVVATGSGERAGGWIKLSHARGVETVYVHLRDISVRQGQEVTTGMVVGSIRGAVGNAIEPQLHLEIKLDGNPVDPVPYMMKVASPTLRARWMAAVGRIPDREEARTRLLEGTSPR